jgi:hypothetical protein
MKDPTQSLGNEAKCLFYTLGIHWKLSRNWKWINDRLYIIDHSVCHSILLNNVMYIHLYSGKLRAGDRRSK